MVDLTENRDRCLGSKKVEKRTEVRVFGYYLTSRVRDHASQATW